jgi:hypothetical protein
VDAARVRTGQERLDGGDGLEGKTLPALPALVGAAVFYAAAFFALTWPAVTRFRTHWFADDGDGLQNVWNVWWVHRAVVVLHESPWFTGELHYPYGSSLLAHTLNPFNGFVAIVLSPFLPPEAAYNALVTFGFVAGGVTAYLLAHRLTGAHLPSLLAGFIFTFSNFHFAHAEGHLQLVSLEWIPLFVLLWLRVVTTPTVQSGIGAAFVLFLVILCDYYYFFYSVIAGAIILAWWVVRNRGLSTLFDGRRLAAIGAFAAVTLATSGVLVGLLLWSNIRDPLTGGHPAGEFSLDLLSPLIYGGHWRFGSLTKPFWQRLPATAHETSVHLGFSVIGLALYAWRKRRALIAPEITLFGFLLVFFLVLALGPTPQIAGKAILGDRAVLPYAWLEAIVPMLTISGVPIRMMVMVMLSAAMLAAFGFAVLQRGPVRSQRAAIAIACLLAIEYLPRPIPTLLVAVPKYVDILRDLPGRDGVLDAVSDQSYALFYQTIHHKPLAFGYLAREPQSVASRDKALEELLEQKRFDRLWPDYRLRYVVSKDASMRTWPGASTLWAEGEIAVLEVATDGRSSPPRAP